MAYGERHEVPKSDMPHVPAGFRRSTLSLPRGSRAVYRDNKRIDSLQLRDFVDYWEFELDRFNPEAGLPEFIGHAMTDAIGVTVVFVVIGALLMSMKG